MRAGAVLLILAACASRSEGAAPLESAPVQRQPAAPPGRYSMALHQTSEGGCSVSSFSSQLSSSVVLSLQDGHRASACRGRYWHSTIWANDGQGQPETTEYVEQQGLSGRWRWNDPWLIVNLAIDDAVCPPIRRGDRRPAVAWVLECIVLDPLHASSPSPQTLGVEAPPYPALACFHDELAWPADLGYVVQQRFGPRPGKGWDASRKGGWLMLGTGNGLSIDEIGAGGMDSDPFRTWKRSQTPIALTAWSLGTPAASAP